MFLLSLSTCDQIPNDFFKEFSKNAESKFFFFEENEIFFKIQKPQDLTEKVTQQMSQYYKYVNTL